jgi:hypothetical protein
MCAVFSLLTRQKTVALLRPITFPCTRLAGHQMLSLTHTFRADLSLYAGLELAASIRLYECPYLAGIQHSLCRCSLSCSSSLFTAVHSFLVTNLLVVVSQCCHIPAFHSITRTEAGLHIAGMYYSQRAISMAVISRISIVILVAARS